MAAGRRRRARRRLRPAAAPAARVRRPASRAGAARLGRPAPRLAHGTSPSAALLLSMTGATAAFAEPRGEVEVPRERATVVVALDVSLSMAADGRRPGPPHRGQGRRGRLRRGPARPLRRRARRLLRHGLRRRRRRPRTTPRSPPPSRTLELGDGTAIGEAVASSLTAVAGRAPGVEDVPPRTSCCSPTAPTPSAARSARRCRTPSPQAFRCRRSPTARRRARCGSSSSASGCRSTRRRSRGWPSDTGGTAYAGGERRRARGRLRRHRQPPSARRPRRARSARGVAGLALLVGRRRRCRRARLVAPLLPLDTRLSASTAPGRRGCGQQGDVRWATARRSSAVKTSA